MRYRLRRWVFAGVLFLPLGCGIYSFTGVALSPEVQSISIQNFYNNAPLGPGNLGIVFTEQMRAYFLENTSLSFVGSEGDLQITGSVEDYNLSPVAAGSAQSSVNTPLTRFTITVSVSYFNTKDSTFDVENQKFSFFKDIDQNNIDFSANEDALVREIFVQIILDIFSKTIAAW